MNPTKFAPAELPVAGVDDPRPLIDQCAAGVTNPGYNYLSPVNIRATRRQADMILFEERCP